MSYAVEFKQYKDYSPKDFMDLIDAQFEQMAGIINRTDLVWGSWSREMNIVIKERLENSKDEKERIALNFVFSYWLCMSQLLDLIAPKKRGFFEKLLLPKKTNDKTEECIQLRNRFHEVI